MREFGFGSQKAIRVYLAILCAFGALLVLGVPAARAQRALIKAAFIPEFETKKVKGGQIEGACGIAFLEGNTYVSDYYHSAIDVFPGAGQIAANPLDGYCGLAAGPAGALYGNEWHEAVYRVLPAKALIDSGESTGVAVDQASGDVYVNDRTYVARYAAPVEVEEPPTEVIGLGSLEEGYGVAVEAGRVYVPDAGTDVVKVYEPAVDLTDPIQVIEAPGGFVSLKDAAIATDPSNGHILVLDNLQPGFEFPEGAVDEFGPGGGFLGQLSKRVIHGEPSGLAVDAGNLYVTTGNSEESNVMQFGPYVAGFSSLAAPVTSGAQGGVERSAGLASTTSDPTPALRPHSAKRRKAHRHRARGRAALAAGSIAGPKAPPKEGR